jgi:polar amino acid transport system substrate-binding protein
MRKYLMGAFLALAAFAFAVTGAFAAEKNYVNGIDANYPPFAYVDKSGKAAGFDVDSMDWIAKKMGFTVTHKPMDWNGIIPDLLANKIDMVCSGMSISPERAARVTFSEPYFTVQKVLVVRAKSKLAREDVLTGKKLLGTQRGTNEAEWLDKNRDKITGTIPLRYYDSAPAANEDLVNGRIDAAGVDSAPAQDAIHKAKKLVKIVGEFAPTDNFGVAMRNEEAELHKLINEGYKLLQADPYWEELKKKYLGSK